MKKLILLLALTTMLTACEAEAPETEDPFANITRYDATLEDLTGGSAVGNVTVIVDNGTYNLIGQFVDLPELEADYFYEGWIVTENADSVISTGALSNETGVWMNVYKNETDLSDHTRYILTLEPDDGDPAPAEHVMEGTFNHSAL